MWVATNESLKINVPSAFYLKYWLHNITCLQVYIRRGYGYYTDDSYSNVPYGSLARHCIFSFWKYIRTFKVFGRQRAKIRITCWLIISIYVGNSSNVPKFILSLARKTLLVLVVIQKRSQTFQIFKPVAVNNICTFGTFICLL